MNAACTLAAEIGVMRYQAARHFLIDGDFKAYNEADFAGAFSDYREAWSFLVTAIARSIAGSDILDGLTEFAASSGNSKLIAEAASLMTAHEQEMSLFRQSSGEEQ